MVRQRDLQFHIATLTRVTAIANSARIGVDVGGTFTDVILQHTDGSATIRKLLSTPPNYDTAVVEAGARPPGQARREGGVHRTAVATDPALQRPGAPTAPLTHARLPQRLVP